MGYLSFEWDEKKNASNKRKHGVSFREAMEIWAGSHVTAERIAQARSGETRNATIGLVGGNLFTAIWTSRKKVIRLISVRRARDGEKKAFYQNLQNR